MLIRSLFDQSIFFHDDRLEELTSNNSGVIADCHGISNML